MADRFYGWHTIYGVDGEHSTPYMTRIWLGRLRLHIFYRGDADPDCHDHPWDFWTLPLTPYVEEVATPDTKGLSYMEALFCGPERYKLHRQVVRAFRLSYRPATHCHRVIGRYNGQDLWDYPGRVPGSEPIPQTDARKIVTLVWRGQSGRKWGFLRNRDGQWCWTPWKEYVFGGGKHAPCGPAEAAPPQPNLRGSIAAFEKAYPELYWHIAKGKICAGEPLYGAIITTIGGTEIGHGESDASAEAAFAIAVAAAGLATTEGSDNG